MWTHCVKACIEFAKDDDEECFHWAEAGECTINPSYVQIHCPESCNYAVSWSPWIRR